ncbi:MAG: hypothetical protein OEZ13_11020 [Spirochaetia bacterium]|nr:hypothetical protein [Spirochaetia bacterium]
MKNLRYYRYILFILICFTFLYENAAAKEYFKSKINFSKNNEHEVNLITFDGVSLTGKLFFSDNQKDKTFITLFADNSSRDVYRKQLAEKISETNAVFMAPTRVESPAKLMGFNYLRWAKMENERVPKFNRIYYKGDKKWDYLEVKDLHEEIKTAGLKKTAAFIPSSSAAIIIENYKDMPNYDYYIFLSPAASLLEVNEKFFNEKKNIIWAASDFQKYTAYKLKEKFGGQVKIYAKAGFSYSMFFRNHEIYADIMQFIDK